MTPRLLVAIAPAILLLVHPVSAQPNCGVPKNINEFPSFVQDELKEIWQHYEQGNKCDQELAIQKDIVDVFQNFGSEDNNSGKNNNKTKFTTPSVDNSAKSPIPLSAAARINQQGTVLKGVQDDPDDYLDQTTFDDVAMLQFDNVDAPFLRSASENVRGQFAQLWNDQDIPSESLRNLKAREEEMRGLSFDAKRTLKRMSSLKARDPGEKIQASPIVKQELNEFVDKLNRRRTIKLVH